MNEALRDLNNYFCDTAGVESKKKTLAEEIWECLTSVAGGFPVVLLRADREFFWSASEWDLLCESGIATRLTRAILQASNSEVLAVVTFYSPIACRIVFVRPRTQGDFETLALDVRGPIIKNGRRFLCMEDFDNVSEPGLYFISQDDEKSLLIERNSWDSRPLSEKHRAILDRSTQEGDGWKKSLGKMAYLRRSRQFVRGGTSSQWMAGHASVWLARLPKLSPRGYLPLRFSFHGPDGVGKSTQIAVLADVLGLPQHDRMRHFFDTGSKTRRAKSTRVLSSKFMNLRLLKFLFFRKFGLSLRRSQLEIFDRHVYDFVDKHAKWGRQLDRRSIAFLVWLQSKVSHPILLVAEPSEVLRRSSELSAWQVRSVYDRLISSPVSLRRRWTYVDTSGGVAQTVHHCLVAISRKQMHFLVGGRRAAE